jgi:RNA polymerase sigma factor (sigma-70 family)
MVFLPHDSVARESSKSGHTELAQEEQRLSAEQRFSQLFLEVWDRFRSPLLRTLSWAEDAENLVTEAYARLWQNRATLPAETITIPFMKAWLVTTCNHLAIDQWRRQQRHPCTSLNVLQRDDEGDVQKWEIADTDGDFTELIGDRDFCQSILHRLAPDDAEILTLRFLVGLAPREIAQVLGIESACASTRITRAKQKAWRLIEASQREK